MTNTSTTPLEPAGNLAWKSAENLESSKTKSENNSPNNEIDEEFDMFTKERVEKKNGQTVVKKTNNNPLEPKVVILNVKNNLGTVDEDEEKGEDIHTMISDAASSITQFCQSNLLRDVEKTQNNESKNESAKDKNPFAAETKKTLERTDSDLDPLLKVNLEITEASDLVKKTETPTATTEKTEEVEQLNFDEISRKPTMFNKIQENSAAMGKSMMPENKPFLRDRSASIGTLNLKTPIAQLIGEQNRTMLFQVQTFGLIFVVFFFSLFTRHCPEIRVRCFHGSCCV